MIRDLEPYSSYKGTEIAWLQEIPNHWSLLRAKRIFTRLQRPVRDDDGIVTAFRDGEVTLRSNRRTDGFTNAEKEIGYQGVRRGDLVIHAMDGFAGAIGVSDSDGKCSPVLSVCVPTKAHQIYTPYYGYLVRQLAVTDFINSLAKGIRERSTEFRYSEFSVLELAIPPHNEQKQIAAFLDYETAKIDALIEKQQQLIDLLGEKRQAVISHAVTKGLNPNAPMRDSGIEWLGEVPAHWKVLAYRRIVNRVIVGIAEAATHAYAETGVPIVRSTNIKSGVIDQSNMLFIDPKFAATLESKALLAGDIVTTRTGANVGASAVVPESLHKTQCFTLVISTPNHESNGAFYAYFINSAAGRCYIDLTAWGSGQSNISVPIIQEMYTVAPPLQEQNQIVAYLELKSASFDVLISKAEETVSLLQERRTSLISAAVTGKIDVRDWKSPDSDTNVESEMDVA